MIRLLLTILTFAVFNCTIGQTNTNIILPAKYSSGEILNIEKSCGYNNDLNNKKLIISLPQEREVDIIKKVLSYTGLPLNFQIFSANIGNAAALIIGEDRIILYDPELLKAVDYTSQTYWTSISILAHEIGHHLSGHTLSANNNYYQKELEADKFSGFTLYKMGATLDQSVAAIILYGDNLDTRTHPNKQKRIEAIKNGWNEAAGYRYNGAVPPPPTDSIFEVYSPEMFIERGYEKTAEYKEDKEYIFNPEIYSGVILEVNNKYDGHPSGETTTAIFVLVEKKEKDLKNFNYNYFTPNEKVWIIYNFPVIGRCSMAEYRNFESFLKPGRKITFSALWEGGNSVGSFHLNHIASLPLKN
ncbi:M48 family metalloprotease [Ferruginibacter sp.]